MRHSPGSVVPVRILNRIPTSHRAFRLCLAALALALLSVSAVGGANAMDAKSLQSCVDQVIADWYDDGRIGKIYPLECYRAALKQLPADVLDYSNAKEEIGRALAFARQGKPDPGGSDPTPTTAATTTSTQPVTTETTKTATTKTETTPTETTPTETTPTETTETSTTDTSGPSSVPVPLLVLGGLAVLLLAAGSAGYLRRRMNGGDDGDGAPPAGA